LAEISFGQWLKRRRNALGLTQEQLAVQISCSTIALRKIEAGDRRPSPQIVEQLATIFNVAPFEQEAFLRFARGDWRAAPGEAAEGVPWRAASTLPRARLPASTTAFVGRERELREIPSLFLTSRLVTLTGPGGVGKTRLALEIARKESRSQPDGVWLVELASFTRAALVPRAVAAALGVEETTARSLTDALAHFLEPKTLLLILDNCEHLIEACARLADDLLRHCPNLRILATSREPLRITGEVTWQVPSLRLADPQHLPSVKELKQIESIRFFVERGRAVLPAFELAGQNAAPIAQICFRLDGIPLALELAATRVNVLTVEEILARLDDRFGLLIHGSRAALDRQQTLRATLDWSYNLLSRSERVLFQRLSGFAGGFSLEAVGAVCGPPAEDGSPGLAAPTGLALPPSEVLGLLGQLVDKSLVVVQHGGREAFYRMLETIRDYARQRLRDSGEAVQVQTRHRDWCAALLDRANLNLAGVEQSVWLNRLELAHGDLQMALEWCLEQNIESGLSLAASMVQFWLRQGYLVEGHQWLERLLAKAPERSTTRARALSSLAMLDVRLGNFTLLSTPREIVAIYEDLGDKEAASRAHQMLGVFLIIMDDFARAHVSLTEALRLANETGSDACAAMAIHYLGLEAAATGEYERARDLFEQSLVRLRTLPDLSSVASFFMNLAHAPVVESISEYGWVYEDETLFLAREVGTKAAIGHVLANLGQLARHQADHGLARQWMEMSLAQFQAIGDQAGIGQLLGQLGNLAKISGDYKKSDAYLEPSLALRREMGDQRGIGRALNNLAELAIREAQFVRAQTLLSESAELFQTMNDKPGLAATLNCLGNLAAVEGDYLQAERLYNQSIDIFESLGVRYTGALILLNLARCARLQGNKQLQRSRLEASLAILKEIGHRHAVAVVEGELSKLDQ
jgi:predicted ATPase/DNA-binding XRE family transcriptional regulator